MGPFVRVGSVWCGGLWWVVVRYSVMEGRTKYLPRTIVLLLSLGVQMLPIYPSS
jgi:hypothetical protein